MKHKWHKEIKAWADGKTIQFKEHEFGAWIDIENDVQPEWNEYTEYQIKPQPKEPQYLYAWLDKGDENIQWSYDKPTDVLEDDLYKYLGKIKLEDK